MNVLVIAWIVVALAAIGVTWWGLHGLGFKKAGLMTVLIMSLIALAVYVTQLREVAP